MASTIKALEAAAPKWISVEDQLPPFEQNVIAIKKNGSALIAKRQKYDYWGKEVDTWNHVNITHWTPLPSPPKAQNNE